MTTVNMLEAKSNLSKLVEAVESGAEEEIIIARNGKPAARLVPLAEAAVDVSKRLGIAEAELADFDYEAFQALDEEIWSGFSEPSNPIADPRTDKRRRSKVK